MVTGAVRVRKLAGGERETAAALLAVLVGYVASAAVDWMWQITALTAIALVALGLLVGTGTVEVARPVRREVPPRAVAAVAAVAVLLALAAEILPYLTQRSLDASSAAAARNDYSAAVRAAEDAHALEPWAATPYEQLALTREAQGALVNARRAIRSAIARDGSDWQLRVIAARIDTKLGLIDSAAAQLREARRLNPNSTFLSGLGGGG
jgi:tetratricopeptide (TPR) repeat protein